MSENPRRAFWKTGTDFARFHLVNRIAGGGTFPRARAGIAVKSADHPYPVPSERAMEGIGTAVRHPFSFA